MFFQLLTIVCLGDLWVNQVSISFFYNWTFKIKIKDVELYRFGIDGLILTPCRRRVNFDTVSKEAELSSVYEEKENMERRYWGLERQFAR